MEIMEHRVMRSGGSGLGGSLAQLSVYDQSYHHINILLDMAALCSGPALAQSRLHHIFNCPLETFQKVSISSSATTRYSWAFSFFPPTFFLRVLQAYSAHTLQPICGNICYVAILFYCHNLFQNGNIIYHTAQLSLTRLRTPDTLIFFCVQAPEKCAQK